MTKGKIISCLLVLCFLCLKITSTVAQYNYINDPGAVNLSVSHQGDFSVLTILSQVERNVQIGYSPYRNFVIKGDYYNQNNEKSSSIVKSNSNQFSIAAGGYFLIKNSSGRRRAIQRKYKNAFQENCLLYFNGGYTRGVIKNQKEITENKLLYNKYFADAGLKLSYYVVSLSINLKYSRLYYQRVIANGQLDGYLMTTIDQLSKNATYSSLEANIMMELGIRQVRAFVAIPASFKVMGTYFARHRSLYAGVLLEIDEVFKQLRGY